MFSKGRSITAFPIKVLFDFADEAPTNLQAAVSTSGRNFKKAVQRNRVKRVLREAYRLQKLPLESALKEQGKSMILFFIYIKKELPDFTEVYEKMGIILQKLQDSVNKNSSRS